MYFKELYNGKINTQQIADVVINEIEMQLELYIEDNMQDTPNFEDLENILQQQALHSIGGVYKKAYTPNRRQRLYICINNTIETHNDD